MIIHWHTWSAESKHRNGSSRLPEIKVTTTLAATEEAHHTLSGEHGRRVLNAIAEQWNQIGYVTSVRPTKVAADYGPMARRRYHIKNA